MTISFVLAGAMLIAPLAPPPATNPQAVALVNPAVVIPGGADPYLNMTGKIQVACKSAPSTRTGVIVVGGQSLTVNSVPTPKSPTQNVDQINIWDDKCYKANDPLLGINMGWSDGHIYGTWMTRLGENLVSHGRYDRVVIVPMGIGNTKAGQWANATDVPYFRNNINVAALRIRDAGQRCTAIIWGQGESDTMVGTSQASYAASMAVVIAEFNRAMPGCPILISKETYWAGTASPAVAAAQVGLVNGTTVFAGSDMDSMPLTPTYRTDLTHLSDYGAQVRADMEEAALVNALGL